MHVISVTETSRHPLPPPPKETVKPKLLFLCLFSTPPRRLSFYLFSFSLPLFFPIDIADTNDNNFNAINIYSCGVQETHLKMDNNGNKKKGKELSRGNTYSFIFIFLIKEIFKESQIAQITPSCEFFSLLFHSLSPHPHPIPHPHFPPFFQNFFFFKTKIIFEKQKLF